MEYFLVIIVFVLTSIIVLILLKGQSRFSSVNFYLKAKSSGFTGIQISELHSAAFSCGIKDLTSIFWDEKSLDTIIKYLVNKNKLSNKEKNSETVVFMNKVFDYRKKITMSSQKLKTGISSSRNLSVNQHMKILAQPLGVFNSVLLENNPRYLVLSYPQTIKIPAQFEFSGKKVSLYFWRQNDAGYVFDSYIMDVVMIRNVPVLHISHSDSLFRAQKRTSVRAKSKLAAQMFLMKQIEGAYEKPEKSGGMRCQILDLSEAGAAILIGGKAQPGLRVKIQLMLGDSLLVMSGITKGVEYNTEKNQSLIHLEAKSPSNKMRNVILEYVYNVFDENDLSLESKSKEKF